MKKLLFGAAALTVAGVVTWAWLAYRGSTNGRPEASSVQSAGREQSTGWPAPAATLRIPDVVFPADFGHHRVYLDPGHGAPGNMGNRSSLCEDEQDFTLRLAEQLAAWLEDTGHFEVLRSRHEGELVPYADRVAEADSWPAAVFLSLHSDVRGNAQPCSPTPGQSCPCSLEAPGFSVLWSDDGPVELAERRVSLARALAGQLQELGLPPYEGTEYRDKYGADPVQPGVFVDRHQPAQRIFVLYRPTMPSVIIETHNAWDVREARRWRDPSTIEAFAAAVTVALIEVLR